ncbi:signal peptidase II [Parachitinimonas caeni]|uniref:Lipoprotein signal peptidase n=1 Tax=Parachitinimonas caeni TaxID=3031301 RepID=A0ABT7DYC9_9NEIS|nr:signal peptidase II [Parachitinimonas caeni]MDK2125072.1 signal peptidase II [Parachitinimonas caeni]
MPDPVKPTGALGGAVRWFVIAFMVIVLDQATKLAAEHFLSPRDVIPIMPSFNLVLAYNPGAAFSFLASAGGWQRWFFMLLAIVVSGVIGRLLLKHRAETLFCWAMSLILGGAIGNLIDRGYLGHVIDFIQLYYGNFYWPAFNIADSAICVGAALMVWDSFRKPKPASQ